MDYLNNHLEITNEEFKILKEFSINSLKLNFQDGFYFANAIDNTCIKIMKEFITPNFINHYNNHFFDLYNIYNNSLNKQDNIKVDAVNYVLKGVIHDEFLKSLKIQRISNLIYGEDFENITYENFVVHLLKYDVYQKCYKRLKENHELFLLFYKANDYKDFTFEKFEAHVVNSLLYKKVYAEFNPNEPIPIAKFKKDKLGGGHYKIKIGEKKNNNFEEKKMTNNYIKTEPKNCNLENKEKSFLFHIMCKALSKNFSTTHLPNKYDSKAFNLPATELCKLSMFIDVQNKNTFDIKKYRDSEHYKILNNGIEYIDKNERQNFLQTLIDKIKVLKLPKTTNYIKDIRNKEHNKSVKPKT
jgi:hypothetical protein